MSKNAFNVRLTDKHLAFRDQQLCERNVRYFWFQKGYKFNDLHGNDFWFLRRILIAGY